MIETQLAVSCFGSLCWRQEDSGETSVFRWEWLCSVH
jgi:hypothetical protein